MCRCATWPLRQPLVAMLLVSLVRRGTKLGGDLLLPVYGFTVGVLVGLTGVGGAVIMTPLLMLGLGMPATAAVGTDLVYNSITKMVGTWQHWRQRTIDRSVVLGLALGSLPAVLVAVVLLAWFRQHDVEQANAWLERGISAMMVVAALLMTYRLVSPSRLRDSRQRANHRATLISVGALGGMLVGLTSIGSGSIIMALLVLIVSLRPERLVGTDVAHAALLVSVAAVSHLLFFQDIDFGLVALLLLGSIPGVLIGSRLSLVIPRGALQIGLAALLVSTAVILWQ